jgi:hypothetical protein
MIFGWFTLLVALTISAIAEYYSIIGLTAIFSSEFWPIVIMGAALAVGKLTAAVWLKLNWERASWLYKLYLVPAVAFLMLLTSIGCFGYLSKAHSEQNLITGDVVGRIAVFDEQIKTAKENIQSSRTTLQQLDEQVNQTLSRTQDATNNAAVNRSVAIRRAQTAERTRVQNQITIEQKRLIDLNEQRAPIAAEVRQVEADVGPIKYIAAMVYGDNPDTNLLEKTVRLLIILIVAVFDPLALVLVLAAQQSIKWAREKKQSELLGAAPAYQPDDGSLTQDQLDQIVATAPKPAIDKIVNQPAATNAHTVGSHPYLTNPGRGRPAGWETEPPSVVKKTIEIMPISNGSALLLDTTFIDPVIDDEDQDLQNEPPAIKAAIKRWKLLNPDNTIKSQRRMLERGEIYQLPWLNYVTDPVTGFGRIFPASARRGDTFVRIDQMPTSLYKYTGSDWIVIDKNSTDSYTYNTAYIDHLIAKIAAGEYDQDLLSASEYEQLTQRLKSNT